jgi:hypothetical protein
MIKGYTKVVKWLPPGAGGFTVFPFIFLRNKHLRNHKVLMNHERIHLIQQLETLVIIGFIIYYIHYRINKKRNGGDKMGAYRDIIFEKEAYANQDNPNYLKERKPYAWLNYR